MHVFLYFAFTILFPGLGDYMLTNEFSSVRLAVDELYLIHTLTMDDIIRSAKEGVSLLGKQSRQQEVENSSSQE